MAGVGRGEAERLFAVHDGLPQAEGEPDDAFFRRLVAHRVEVQRPGDAGQGGEPQPAVLAAAHFLQDDGHLFLGNDVSRRRDVTTGRGEIDRGIDALDSLGNEAQLLVLVLGSRHHVSGIDAGKRLIVRVFQFGGRADGQRLPDVADEDPQGIRQIPGQGGGGEFGEDLPVRKVRVDNILEAVLEDEPVEEVRGDDKGSRDQDADAFPMVIEVVPLENLVQEGQAAGLAAQGTVPEAGEADGVVVALGLEAGHDAESLGHPVVADGPDGGRPALRLVVEAALLDAVADLEEAAGEEPAGDIVFGRQPGQVGIRKGGDDALGAVQVAGTGDLLPGLGIRDHEIAEPEFPADEFRQVMREGLGALHEEAGLEG